MNSKLSFQPHLVDGQMFLLGHSRLGLWRCRRACQRRDLKHVLGFAALTTFSKFARLLKEQERLLKVTTAILREAIGLQDQQVYDADPPFFTSSPHNSIAHSLDHPVPFQLRIRILSAFCKLSVLIRGNERGVNWFDRCYVKIMLFEVMPKPYST